MTRFIRRCLPGVFLCILISLTAALLEHAEMTLLGSRYVDALIIALLLGIALRAAWSPGPAWKAGVDLCAKLLLEVAVVLLGASLSVDAVFALGPAVLFGIAGLVAVAAACSFAICRLLGLGRRVSALVACGNSICGNSAIIAVAPIIAATRSEIAVSIAFTAVLGVIVVLGLPLLVPILDLSQTQYGMLAGLSVYAVPQVLAATLPIGALSNQVGIVIKLVRVLMLGPMVLVLSLLGRKARWQDHGLDASEALNSSRGFSVFQFLPWFVIGFLCMMMGRSLGLLPQAVVAHVSQAANVLTTLAMAGLGLGVDVREVAHAGARVSVAVTLSLMVLIALSLTMVWLVSA